MKTVIAHCSEVLYSCFGIIEYLMVVDWSPCTISKGPNVLHWLKLVCFCPNIFKLYSIYVQICYTKRWVECPYFLWLPQRRTESSWKHVCHKKIAFLHNHTFFISSIYTFASIFTILHLHYDAVPSHHVTLADLRLVSIQMTAGSSAHL